MLTERQIEQFGYGNEKIFVGLEQRIIDAIVKRIKKSKRITKETDYQLNALKQLGFSNEEIHKMVEDALGQSKEYVDNLYSKVIDKEYILDKSIYEMKGVKYVPFEENLLMQNIVQGIKRQTLDELENLTKTMGFVLQKDGKNISYSLSEYYRLKMDEIVKDVILGNFDFNKTLKKAIDEMTKSGVRSIDYATGWHNRITVASRRSIMTGISNIAMNISDYNAEKLDTEYFEVSAHDGARPSHALWQGQVYTKEELETVCGLGTVTGLLGANCYHTYYPFFKGISERAYTDKELRQWQEEKSRVYKDKEITRYEASQIMRQNETNMRAMRERIHALKVASVDKAIIDENVLKLKTMEQEYKDLSKLFGLKEQRERITLVDY